MAPDGIRVRRARAGEIPLFAAWATAEGWNPGDGDVGVAHVGAPDGFLVAVEAALDTDGGDGGDRHVVGIIAVMRYSPRYAFVGYFIVRREWQRRGVGRLLMDAAVGDAVQDGTTTLALDSVLEQAERYERWARFQKAFVTVRHGGRLPPRAAPFTAAKVVRAADLPFDVVLAYERRFSGGDDRSAFLRRWIDRPGAATLCLLDAATGEVAGLGSIRPGAHGFRVGPVFARSAGTAEDLLYALAEAVSAAGDLFVDVPECSSEGTQLVRRLGWTPSFSCVRMYAFAERGGVPPTDDVYGVFSFEFGP